MFFFGNFKSYPKLSKSYPKWITVIHFVQKCPKLDNFFFDDFFTKKKVTVTKNKCTKYFLNHNAVNTFFHFFKKKRKL